MCVFAPDGDGDGDGEEAITWRRPSSDKDTVKSRARTSSGMGTCSTTSSFPWLQANELNMPPFFEFSNCTPVPPLPLVSVSVAVDDDDDDDTPVLLLVVVVFDTESSDCCCLLKLAEDVTAD